ncbi:MAG: cytochrome b/b6 domain-containing protein [Acidobacteriota bacterium]|nr:cytochrome b/b6 domain-containing protein [Acidobacteriota bacterium]
MAAHPISVRICHWMNLVACGFLLWSGVHIFLDFPELYWGDTGYQGYPAIFKLSDWGLSWDQAGELGDRMWGRNYHFTFAWVFLLNGVFYVGWNLLRGTYKSRMFPTRNDLAPRQLWATVKAHLRWPRPEQRSPLDYNTLQKLSYLSLVFVYVPLMLLTGIAQAPAFAAAWPWLLDMFGGRQTARTLHAIGTVVLVAFVAVHIFEVFGRGALARLRSMTIGRISETKDPS